jgi:hypothetical protein
MASKDQLRRQLGYEWSLVIPSERTVTRIPPKFAAMKLTLIHRTLDTNKFEHRAIYHKCLTATGSNDGYELPREQCLRMRAETFFPSCWDGKNLDSSDHKSHVSTSLLLSTVDAAANHVAGCFPSYW